MRIRTGRRLAGVLSLSVTATLVAGLASAAAAATVPGGPARGAATMAGWPARSAGTRPGGPARTAATVPGGTALPHVKVPGEPALAGAMTSGVPAVPGPGNTTQLTGVTCEPAGHCWAVGSYQHGGSRNEVFSWNGHGWVRVGVPEPRHQSATSPRCATSRCTGTASSGRPSRT
jgi:hypothetical protein